MKFIYENITIDPITNCWNWNKSVTSAGYGQFTRNKKYWTTHTFVYTQTYGDIPKGMVIRHTCHNRRCCNPEHLLIGTHEDNWHDSRETHLESSEKLTAIYIINGKEYRKIKNAIKETGLSSCSICKYTDKQTRIFDIDSYRIGCAKARKIPKI